jgi:Luciferase-like monooxygenase
MFTLRFDMRAPTWAGPPADLYAAAIDMCAWAETRGVLLAVLSEHHGADDDHLLAPLMLASAIAARTSSLAILLAAVPIPLWDPVRLAEEMSVLTLGEVEGHAAGRAAMASTAMRVVNAIPYVVDAAPGLLSSLDIPTTLPRHVFD